jgi:branched-chain amino acid transport system permease protein
VNQALFIAFIFAIVINAIVFFFLYRTEMGAVIRATINNKEVISLLGIDPKRIYLISFTFGSILTAIGAVLLSFYYPVSPTVGNIYNSFMWVALVLGGAGSIRGSLIGGFIIGVSQVVSALFLPINLQNVVAFTLFIITIALRPQGLFGE